jgi:hypothetical protein
VASDFNHMKNVIIPNTFYFTRDYIAKQRHEEYLRAKVRKAVRSQN